MNRLKHDRIYYIFIFALMLIIERYSRNLGIGNDDFVFSEGIKNLGLITWMKSFYNGWSGRLIITALDGIFCGINVYVWKILNAMVFVNLIYQIDKIIDGKWLDRILILTLIIGMPIAVFSSSNLWITGSLNYLWPVSFGMVIIRIVYDYLKGIKISTSLYVFGIISCFIAGNMEQVSAICLVLVLFAIVYKYKNVDKRFFFLLTIITINFIIVIMAPGNFIRAESELLQWNPQFGMYNIFDKINCGLFALVKYLINDGKYYLLFLFTGVFVKTYKRFYSYIPMVYISLKFIIDFLLMDNYIFKEIYDNIYGIYFFNQGYYLDISKWLPIVIFVIVIIIVIYYLLDIINDDIDRLFILLILLAGFASVIVIGFSPTLLGSGSRIYYCLNILLVLIIGLLFKDSKYFKILMILVFGYFSFQAITLFVTYRDFLYELY